MRRSMHVRGLPAATGKELMLINELDMEASSLKDQTMAIFIGESIDEGIQVARPCGSWS